MTSKRKPDFFIIGAPKCGTTALSEYLREHPQVFFSDPKEPFFFCTDFPEERRQARTTEEYEALFAGAGETALVVGEGSTWYLASRVAVRNIMAYQPDAKFIIMLRNPLEMVRSLHSQNIAVQDEDCLDFRRAWTLCDERRDGRGIPLTCGNPKFLQYGEICSLGKQLERAMKLIPEENLLCIVYDEFSTDTPGVYRKVLDFLGVPDDGRTDFARVNANRGYRLGFLHELMFAGPVYRGLRKIKSLTGINRGLGIYSVIERSNLSEMGRNATPDDMVHELKDYFRDDVELLTGLLQRDLMHWVS